MDEALYERLRALVVDVLRRYPGAWLVWCDRRDDWKPLLERAARAGDGFDVVDIEARVGGEVGGLRARVALQERLDRGVSFVLRVPVGRDRLGWLWGQALLAERIFDRPLRDQLRDWGWRPHSLTASDDEVAAVARARMGQDPAEWGGGLQPEPDTLLQVLAGGFAPDDDHRTILDLTIEAAGLPPVDAADIERWRIKCLARLLVTQAHHVAPSVVGSGNELLIATDRRAFALDLLARWLDRLSLRRGLPDAIVAADPMTGLAATVVSPAFPQAPFASLRAESALMSAICRDLAALSGRDLLEAVAARAADFAWHAAGLWGELENPRALPWADLSRLAGASRAVLEASPGGAWASPAEAIAWYTSGGWRVDQAGQEIARTVSRPARDLLALLEPLRAAFRARWESLMIDWSETWTAAGCPLPAVPTAGEWLREQLQAAQATAVVVCDALRYDLGAELAARVNAREGAARARISAARAPLPSVTALGMGTALPVAEEQLQAEVVDGKWQLLHRGDGADLSQAAARRAWLTDRAVIAADAYLSVSEALAAVPAPAPARMRLFLTDAIVDKLGHDDELEALGGGPALDRYASLVERLRDAGWRRVLFVTDHGFIHWPSGEERNVTPPAPDPVYSSRRALAYPASTPLSGPYALAPGGRWAVAVPRGAASFRAYGGLGYFHGGASLQEWIIPCVAIEWPAQARPVQVALRSPGNVLSRQPRITLAVERPSLLVEDSIPRQVSVVIRHGETQAILFRSERVTLAPSESEVPVLVAAVEGLAAARGVDLRIEVRDAHTEEVLASAPSKLMIDLSDW